MGIIIIIEKWSSKIYFVVAIPMVWNAWGVNFVKCNSLNMRFWVTVRGRAKP